MRARFYAARTYGFTLLEVMVIVGIIAVVCAIALPTWFRQRELSRAAACQENLAKIDQAVQIFALEHQKNDGDAITYPADLIQANSKGYLKKEPHCDAGGTYIIARIGDTVTCTIGNSNNPFASHELQN